MSDLKNLAAKFKIPSPDKIDQSHTILLVENQQDQRLIIAHHLAKMGYNKVAQASSGLEALDFLRSTSAPISAMISSMEMEPMTGLELLAEIKEVPEIARPPFTIAMLSPSKEKIMLSTETGVDEIMVKPYTLKDFFPKLQKAFKIFHNPQNPEKVYELAKKFYREEKFDAAHSVFKEIAGVTTAAARPFVGMARVAILTGKIEEAFEYLKEAERRNKHYVHIYVVRGRAYAEQNNLEQAVACFKQAIDLSPLNPARYEDASAILFNMKKYEQAIELLNIAIKNDLSFPKLHHYLSQAHYATKDYKNAIKHIKSALSVDPENTTYLNQLGISYKESQQYDEAIKVYNSTIKLDPENMVSIFNKAVLLHTMGKGEEAVKHLDRILKKDPDFPNAAQKKAEYEKELDDTAAASAS